MEEIVSRTRPKSAVRNAITKTYIYFALGGFIFLSIETVKTAAAANRIVYYLKYIMIKLNTQHMLRY